MSPVTVAPAAELVFVAGVELEVLLTFGRWLAAEVAVLQSGLNRCR